MKLSGKKLDFRETQVDETENEARTELRNYTLSLIVVLVVLVSLLSISQAFSHSSVPHKVGVDPSSSLLLALPFTESTVTTTMTATVSYPTSSTTFSTITSVVQVTETEPNTGSLVPPPSQASAGQEDIVLVGTGLALTGGLVGGASGYFVGLPRRKSSKAHKICPTCNGTGKAVPAGGKFGPGATTQPALRPGTIPKAPSIGPGHGSPIGPGVQDARGLGTSAGSMIPQTGTGAVAGAAATGAAAMGLGRTIIRTCPHCDAEIPKSAVNCPRCGIRLNKS